MNHDLGEPLVEGLEFRWMGYNWLAACLIIAGITLAVVGGFLMFEEIPDTSIILFALAACLLVPGGIVWYKRSKYRSVFHLYTFGCIVEAEGQRQEVAFDQVVSMKLERKSLFENGEYRGLDIILDLCTDASPQARPALSLRGRLKNETADHERSDEIMAMLTAAISTVYEVRWQQGTALVGDGFTLRREMLETAEASLPLADIARTDIFENSLCIWKRNEEEPCIRLKLGGNNIYPLMHILDQREKENEDETENTAGMGRLLFQRQVAKSTRILITAVAVAAMVVMALGIVGMMDKLSDDALLMGLGGGVALLVFGVWAWFCWRSSLRCYENGVRYRGFFSPRELRYAEIQDFTYSATRQYYNGAYVGTSLTLRFDPQPGLGKPRISYSTTVRNDGGVDLDGLRDHIGRVIAVRLLAEIEAGQSVAWGDAAELTPDGVRYRDDGLLRKGDWKLLPWESCPGGTFNDGTFHIFSEDAEKSVCNINISVKNFFPVLAAFMLLKYGDGDGGDNGDDTSEGEDGAPEPASEIQTDDSVPAGLPE